MRSCKRRWRRRKRDWKDLKQEKGHAEAGGPGLQDANTALASALRVVENGDRAAPAQAIAVYEESSRQVKARIAEWTRFKQTQLEQVNRQLREAKLAPVGWLSRTKSCSFQESAQSAVTVKQGWRGWCRRCCTRNA